MHSSMKGNYDSLAYPRGDGGPFDWSAVESVGNIQLYQVVTERTGKYILQWVYFHIQGFTDF